MSCLPISPFAISGGCPPRMGGIRSVLWARRSGIRIDAVNYEPSNADYSVEMTKSATGQAFRIPVLSGSFTSTAQVSDDGTIYYRDELTFVPVAYSESAAALLAALSAASDDALCLIAEDYNGRNWILGFGFADANGATDKFPVWLSGGSQQSGSARADLNGVQVTLASVHPLPAAVAFVTDVIVDNPNDF